MRHAGSSPVIRTNKRKAIKNMKKPDLHIVSFSGGKDSTAMLLHMMELGMQIDIVLYCDTWMDFPAMYRHVEKVKKIVEDAGIKFVTLKNPKSFKYMMLEHTVKRKKPIPGNRKGYSWPGSRSRWCTSKLKTDMLSKYKNALIEQYNVIEYVGIAADEQYRLEREQNKHHEHPLVDWGWNEAKALSFCYNKGFDWEGLYEHFSRVSCWCCPLQPLETLRKLRRYYPELWQELIEMDRATWRQFRPEFSVDELEIRFALEEERTAQNLTINGHSKEFRQALKERLQQQQNFLK